MSRSTITAWRNGSKPEFAMCLRLAEHFKLDPLVMFRMVGDANYEKVYRRFFIERVESSRLAGQAAEAGRSGPVAEDEFYPDQEHASIHRELQFVLEAESRESKAVATMIHLAAKQLEAQAGQEPIQHRPPSKKTSSSKRKPQESGAKPPQKQSSPQKRRNRRAE